MKPAVHPSGASTRDSARLRGSAAREHVRTLLSGGDRRSLGRADEVAALVLAGELPFEALFAGIFSEDPVVQGRALDAVEKVSAQRPDWLRAHRAEFLAALPDFRRPEWRWHAAQILPRLGLSTGERDALAIPTLLGYLEDSSRIVQTCALQALTDFALADPALRPQVIGLVETAARTGSPAVRARCRRLLVELGAATQRKTLSERDGLVAK